jgi:hypothetical protein
MRETFLARVGSLVVVASLLALPASTKAQAPDKIALCQSVMGQQLRASCIRNLRQENPQKSQSGPLGVRRCNEPNVGSSRTGTANQHLRITQPNLFDDLCGG